MLKDMFKRKELICISCQKKIQYEEELVAFVKLPKERNIL
ncbi:SAM-dependent methyltransferase [Bacillus cereus]|nr:SAM-dependent methyltransferase [Bacillus cereus]WJX08027.1 SAM-dependent methyltransferase [Bacillus cereus]